MKRVAEKPACHGEVREGVPCPATVVHVCRLRPDGRTYCADHCTHEVRA